MKALDILRFFITVGILGFNYAEVTHHVSEHEKAVDGWMRTIQQQACEKNGGPKAFEPYENSYRTVQECTSNVMREIQHEANVKIGRSCNKLRALRECLEPFIETAKSCQEPEMRKTTDISYNIFTRITDFACNNTEKIEEFMADGGVECVLSKYQDLLICAEDMISFGAAAAAKSLIIQLHGRLDSVWRFKFGSNCSVQDGCQTIESFQTCSIGVLNECKNKLPAELLESMLKYVNQAIPCKNLIKSHA